MDCDITASVTLLSRVCCLDAINRIQCCSGVLENSHEVHGVEQVIQPPTSSGWGTSRMVSAGALTTITVCSLKLGIIFTSSYDRYRNVGPRVKDIHPRHCG